MNVVGKNIVWLLLSQSATWVLTLVTLIVVPRVLGVDDFGAVNFAAMFVQYFAMIAGLESGPVIIRTVARDASSLPSLVRNGIALRVVSVAVLAVVALAISFAMDLSDQLIVLIAIGCVGMLIGNLNHVLTSALSGIQRMARPAMWATVQLYAAGFFGVLVIVAGGGAYAYALVAMLAALIPLIANWSMLRPYMVSRPRLDRRVLRALLTGGLPLLLLTALTQFYGIVDFPILQSLGGSTAVGWYSVATRWSGIPFFICTAVIAAYFPRLAELAPAGGAPFARATNQALSLVVLVSVPFAFGLVAVADDLIALLYDDDFAPVVPVLRVLALQVPITAVDTVLGTALVASERVRQYTYVAAAAAVLTPIALIVSINAFADGESQGALGAAVVTSITELFVFGGAFMLRAPGVLDRQTSSRLIRAVAAGSVIVPALWLVDGWHLFVKAPLAIVVYVVAAVTLRVFTIQDLLTGVRNVRDVVRRRGTGTPVGEAPKQPSP